MSGQQDSISIGIYSSRLVIYNVGIGLSAYINHPQQISRAEWVRISDVFYTIERLSFIHILRGNIVMRVALFVLYYVK